MRRIVCDTGPLIHLHEADLLETLREAGRLFAPAAVKAELLSFDPVPDWLRIEPLIDPFGKEARTWIDSGLLHRGEAEAVGLAKQLRADWLVTDDAAARVVGQREGLEIHGSLGVLLYSAATGHLDGSDARAGLERLIDSSLWISSEVIEEARAALEQLVIEN